MRFKKKLTSSYSNFPLYLIGFSFCPYLKIKITGYLGSSTLNALFTVISILPNTILLSSEYNLAIYKKVGSKY